MARLGVTASQGEEGRGGGERQNSIKQQAEQGAAVLHAQYWCSINLKFIQGNTPFAASSSSRQRA